MPSPSTCPNCGHALAQPLPKFCGHCGQETHIKAPTLREFAQQFGGAYFSTEGALWRTLKLLLFKPGELTRQYFGGRRKHYVLPLRLYLTVSVLALLIVKSVAHVEITLADTQKAPPVEMRNGAVNFGSWASAGLRKGVFFCEGFPAWMCTRMKRRMDVNPEALLREFEQGVDRLTGNLGGTMFVLLPSFALWLKLVYLNRRLRYTEHLVFALHLHTFWFLALLLTLLGQDLLTAFAIMALPAYALLAMKRAYAGRWWPLLVRAALVSLLYGVTMTFAVVGLVLWTLVM
jgi:Protein of unknown function (DUF3667)